MSRDLNPNWCLKEHKTTAVKSREFLMSSFLHVKAEQRWAAVLWNLPGQMIKNVGTWIGPNVPVNDHTITYISQPKDTDCAAAAAEEAKKLIVFCFFFLSWSHCSTDAISHVSPRCSEQSRSLSAASVGESPVKVEAREGVCEHWHEARFWKLCSVDGPPFYP